MAYSSEVAQVSEQINQQRVDSLRWKFCSQSMVAVFKQVFQRQSQYLLWTAILLFIHLAEVVILGVKHHVYFSPGSLLALRSLSSLSFLGLLFALAQRSCDKDQTAHDKPIEQTRQAVMALARVLILCSSAIVLFALVGFLMLPTFLKFSPVIYRALIVSHVLTLPFDIAGSYLLFSSVICRAQPLSKSVRYFSIASAVLALCFLYLGWAVAYLIVTLLPRVVLLHVVWREISASSWTELFKFKHIGKLINEKSTRLVVSRAMAVAFILGILELNMFVLFAGVTGYDGSLALTIFFIHKIVHLGAVIGIKLHLSLASTLRSSLLARGASVRAVVLSKLGKCALLSSLFPIFALPILILQKNTLLWASPTGEYFVISSAVVVVSGLIVILRVAAYAFASMMVHASRRQQLKLLIAATITPACCLLLARLGNDLINIYSLTTVFVILALWDLLLSVICIYAVHRLVSNLEYPRTSPQDFTLITELFKHCQTINAVSPRSILLIKLWPSSNESCVDRVNNILRTALSTRATVCSWGLRSIFVFELPNAEGSSVADQVLELCGSQISQLESCSDRQEFFGNPLLLLSSLLNSQKPLEALYQLALDRQETGQSNEQRDSTDNSPYHLLQRGKLGWDLSTIGDLELRSSALQYLSKVESENRWDPTKAAGQGLKRFFHIVDNGKIKYLGIVKESCAIFATEVRRRAFVDSVARFIEQELGFTEYDNQRYFELGENV